jgi:tripartite-type tricarboxylate transporter receptor subunit TctC
MMLKAMSAALVGLVALLAATAGAGAADYPDRPVTIVVGFPPGGASDIMARIITSKLSSLLGQPFVVDNRPGAGGNVAGDVVAHAAPDGYTLLLGNNAILATNVSLYNKIDFDPVRDFAPVSLVGTQANVLVVNLDVPAKSLAELIALAKANPGKLNFASSGYGLAAHLAGELFKAQAGIDIVHVPYKGSAPALQDVIAGDDQMMFATTSGVMGFLKNEQLRPLAVTTLKRTPILPDIGTMDELGLKGFEATTWHGLVVPAGDTKPCHVVASKPRMPSSSTVGISGRTAVRLSVVTASGRSCPFLMKPITDAAVANIIWSCPAMTSWSAGAAPL